MRGLTHKNIADDQSNLIAPVVRKLIALSDKNVQYPYLSSNLNGELLIQKDKFTSKEYITELIDSNNRRHFLNFSSQDKMELLPAGGGLITSTLEGIVIRPLIKNEKKMQILPGRRELGCFCAASGRAVLIRHWPDYRRSIEIIMPGIAPKQLYLGNQAVLAVSCDNVGKRVWAILGRWIENKGEHEIVEFGNDGKILQRTQLNPWKVQAGTKMQFDQATQQLLLTVTKPNLRNARVAIYNTKKLTLEKVLPLKIQEAYWLRAG